MDQKLPFRNLREADFPNREIGCLGYPVRTRRKPNLPVLVRSHFSLPFRRDPRQSCADPNRAAVPSNPRSGIDRRTDGCLRCGFRRRSTEARRAPSVRLQCAAHPAIGCGSAALSSSHHSRNEPVRTARFHSSDDRVPEWPRAHPNVQRCDRSRPGTDRSSSSGSRSGPRLRRGRNYPPRRIGAG